MWLQRVALGAAREQADVIASFAPKITHQAADGNLVSGGEDWRGDCGDHDGSTGLRDGPAPESALLENTTLLTADADSQPRGEVFECCAGAGKTGC